jgi:hypothetical protein
MDNIGRTVRFEPIEGDDEHVRMIETFDLRHPNSPFLRRDPGQPWPLVKPPADMLSVEKRHVVSKFVEDGMKIAGEYPVMESHQQRVVDEESALSEKIVKLSSFISSNTIFKTLPEREQSLLRRQLQHMLGYSAVLSERISAFKA